MRSILFDVLEINIVMTLVILLLCVFAGKLRKRYGAMWLKVMWIVLMVRLLIPYNFSLPDTEFRLFNVPGFEQETSGGIITNEIVGQQNLAIEENENSTAEYIESHENVSVDTFQKEDDSVMPQAPSASPIIAPDGTDESLSTEEETNQPGQGVQADELQSFDNTEENGIKVNASRYTDILLYVWLIGIGISVLYHVFVYIRVQKKLYGSVASIENHALNQRIFHLQEKYLGKVKLNAQESTAVQSPVITGLLLPKLIIPSNKKDWKDQELELVIAHELCHYLNKDLWLRIFMLGACCIHWFNPAVYWMKKQFYYDMELVCDTYAMKGRSNEEKEAYARILLDFAGKSRKDYTFMTGLSAGNKLTKNRIYHIWENKKKKKGIVVFACMIVACLGIGLFVSCGYKPGENESTMVEDAQEENGQNNITGNIDDVAVITEFNYNNEHNKMVRVYDDKTYVARTDGIYVMEAGELRCLYENQYNYHRGFDIYDDAIYFTGSIPGGEERRGTVYRMDLNIYEVKDVLAAFSEEFYGLYTITIHEGNLYTANTEGYIGFVLDDDGMAVSRLDETDEDFIYKEFNQVAQLETEKYIYDSSTAEGQEIREQLLQAYYPVIDSVTCAEMLNGKYVVTQYNDESTSNIFLVDENENYILLNQYGYSCPILVTEQGIYYSLDWSGDIYYMTYDGSVNQCVFDKPGNWDSVYMITYDAQYLYFTTEITVGGDVDNITKTYIVRVPRNGGKYEAVYEVQGDYSPYIHLPGECGIDSEYMYFYEQYDGNSFIKLEPVEIAEAELHSFKQEEVASVPEVQIYSFENAKELGQSWEICGFASGDSATWHIIEIEGVEYFYVEHVKNGQMVTELYNYAILGEQYSLANGFRVGDPVEEIFTRYPNMAKIYFQDDYITSLKGCLGWSGTTYPHSHVGWDENYEYVDGDYNWTNQFDYAIVGNVVRDNDIEAPLYVALLVKDEFVEAITFYSPTDGPGNFVYDVDGNAGSDEKGNSLLHSAQYELEPGMLCQIKLYGKMLNEYNCGISYVEITTDEGNDYSFTTKDAMSEYWDETTECTECWNEDGGLRIEDINFDGYADIGLQAQVTAYNMPYIYYVYDVESGQYKYFGNYMCFLQVDAENETCLEEYRAGQTYYADVWAKDNAGGLYLMSRTVTEYDWEMQEVSETTEYFTMEE